MKSSRWFSRCPLTKKFDCDDDGLGRINYHQYYPYSKQSVVHGALYSGVNNPMTMKFIV